MLASALIRYFPASSSIPYTGIYQGCRWPSSQMNIDLSYLEVATEPLAIKKHLTDYGVLVITVDADNWKYYRGGVFDLKSSGWKMGPVNHQVNLVGYDVKDRRECWIVRNSWGTDWGEGGYMYIAMDPLPNSINGTQTLAVTSC